MTVADQDSYYGYILMLQTRRDYNKILYLLRPTSTMVADLKQKQSELEAKILKYELLLRHEHND